MKPITDSERLQAVLDGLGESAYSIHTKLGYTSHGAVYHVVSGKNALSEGMIRRIVESFPNVSYTFLKNGIGKPLLRTVDEQNQQNILNTQGNAEHNFLLKLAKMPEQLDNIERMLKQLLGKE